MAPFKWLYYLHFIFQSYFVWHLNVIILMSTKLTFSKYFEEKGLGGEATRQKSWIGSHFLFEVQNSKTESFAVKENWRPIWDQFKYDKERAFDHNSIFKSLNNSLFSSFCIVLYSPSSRITRESKCQSCTFITTNSRPRFCIRLETSSRGSSGTKEDNNKTTQRSAETKRTSN